MNNDQPTINPEEQAAVPQAPAPAPGGKRKITRIVGAGIVVLAILLGAFWFFRGRVQREVAVLPEEAARAPEEVPYVDPFPDDLDRDGIPNAREAELGTSQTEYDTDGDGLSDVDEIDFWKTDPLKADTDTDGFSDGWEVISGYNPAGPGKLE